MFRIVGMWACLTVGALILIAADPMIAAGVAFIMLGVVLGLTANV